VAAAADRMASDPDGDPMTGAELGAGPGSGLVDDEELSKPRAAAKARRK
jgi:hypothetical protein